MDLTSRLVYTLIVIFTIFRFGLGSGLVLSAHPQNFDSMTHQLNISCQVQSPSAKSVAYIEVKKEKTGKLFYINYLEVLTKGPGFRYNMKAVGYIGTDDGNTFLNVMINGPNSTDAGMYKCQVYFYDELYNWSEETVVSNVTFVERHVTEKVSFLMTTVREQNTDMTKNQEQFEMIIDIIKRQNDTINTQEWRLDNMTKTLERDVIEKVSSLRTADREQNKQIKELDNEIRKKQQQLGTFIDMIKVQNKTIHNLEIQMDNMTKKQERDATDRVHSIRRIDRKQNRQINKLNNGFRKQQHQLDTFIDLIKVQNTSIDTHEVRPDKITKKIALLQTGWKYYAADKTFIKAFAKDDGSKQLSWTKARESCQTYGGDLVQIHDEAKNNFVYDLFDGASYGYPWIGIKNTARRGFVFKYVDGSDLGSYHPWWPGDPNGDTDDNDKCVVMSTSVSYNSRTWYDAPCSESRTYVCFVSSLNVL